MKRLVIVLLTVAIFAVVVASSVSAQVPADEACANAIPRAGNAGATLPFNLCISLP